MSAVSSSCHQPGAKSSIWRHAPIHSLLLLLATLLPMAASAGGPVFSHMTLNGITGVALSIEA